MSIRERIGTTLQRWFPVPAQGSGDAATMAVLIPGYGAVKFQSVDELRPLFEQGDDAALGHAKIGRHNAGKYFRRWQYAAGTAIADALLMSEYEVQSYDGEEWSEVEPADPLARLLRRPNPKVSMRTMLYFLGLDLAFLGEHYWLIAYNGVQEPAELWPLLGRMEIERDADNMPIRYKMHVETKLGPRILPYEPDEIIGFRMPQFQDMFAGASHMDAAAGSVKLDDQVLRARWQTFKRGVFPSLVVAMSERDPTKRTAIIEEINQRYGGSGRTGAAMGINKETMDVKDIRGATTREMDYSNSTKDVRDEILGMFRVPPVLAGVTRDVQNRATAEAAEYVFAKWNIWPKLLLVQDQLNFSLVEPCFGENYRVKFLSPVPEDREQDRAENEMLARTYAITPNEMRGRYGYEPEPWGDLPLVPLGVAPLGEEIGGEGGEGQAQALKALTIEEFGFDRKSRRVVARLHQEQQAKFARGYRKAWGGAFGDLKAELLAAFDAAREGQALWLPRYERHGAIDPIDTVLSPERLASFFRGRSKPFVVRGLILGGAFDGELARVPGRAKWGADSRALLRYAVQYDDGYYRGIADTTHRQMTALVGRMLEERATWEEIRRAVGDTFDAWRDGRAANIATTESTKLMGAGGQAFREEFELGRKQWVASFVNTRDSHAAADGQVRENNEMFEVGSDRMMYPGGGTSAEENCTCNCAAVAAVKG